MTKKKKPARPAKRSKPSVRKARAAVRAMPEVGFEGRQAVIPGVKPRELGNVAWGARSAEKVTPIQVKVSAAERAAIVAAAKSRGWKLSRYMRTMALAGAGVSS